MIARTIATLGVTHPHIKCDDTIQALQIQRVIVIVRLTFVLIGLDSGCAAPSVRFLVGLGSDLVNDVVRRVGSLLGYLPIGVDVVVHLDHCLLFSLVGSTVGVVVLGNALH